MKWCALSLLFSILYVSVSNTWASELGELKIFDSRMGSRTIIYEKKGPYAVVEGDIILGKIATLMPKSASILLPVIGRGRWPRGIIPYEISDDLPLMNKLAALQAISIVQQYTNVRFIDLTTTNRDEYSDYISFVPVGGTSCSSYVGKQRGRQVITLAPRCNAMSTVHEIGHALGLWHEQSREDRDNYVQILWENIDEEKRYNFNQHLTDGEDFGEYDYESIMHYNPRAFSKNGQETIIPLKEGVDIGQRDHLSQRDIEAINHMYPAQEFKPG